ncbi:MAG TPA: FtsW/RodA/SpoVE family cell cycle protein [Armatimonadota bacterium]|nr:FtsW/RodA/SpoVE family cell cycle protein [Armatimonadota bacterium]
MTSTLHPSPPAPVGKASDLPTPTPRSGFRGRGPERLLLLWNAPLVLLAAWGVAAAQRHPSEAFVPALMALGTVWLACLALHVILCITKFDGDLLILPLLSLLLLIGAAYHLDLPGPATPGMSPGPYTSAALLAIVVLAVVTAGGRWFKRLSHLVEERVWWRVAGDRPYYESIPFHLLLLAMMLLLAVLLLVGGVRSDGGALIQVRLPWGTQFTPSELIRLAVAFFLADYLGRNSRILRNLRQPLGRVWPLNRIHMERRSELLVVLTMVGLYCLFFYAFRDFGPAAVIIVLTLATLYASTGRVWTPLLLGLGITVAIAVPTWKNIAFHTFRNRADMWLDPWDTHFVNGDHQARILWSIASGGWFGMGVGTQNLPYTLPLARNDAAFAGVAASMGLWTALAVLALFAGITWRGMLAAREAKTDRMRLLGFCLTALLAFQAVWICGAMVRVFPFTGINVPFVSTGLSSMLASALALATIWNISRGGGARVDATEATPEVLRGVTRMAVPVTAAFALPALGILLYGCPWLLGDRTLVQAARGIERGGGRASFTNPYLERFKKRFPRGRVFSADDKLLAVSNPSPQELQAIREVSPTLADQAERGGDPGERYYPMRATSAQLIGWTPQGKFAAQAGSVEAEWDGMLRGYHPSQLPFYYRTRHNPLVQPPQPQDLQLTIQTDVQRLAAQELGDAVKKWRGAGGALMVYDVGTGAVLAAVTSPTFDPNGLTLERMQGYVDQHANTQVLTNKALARSALFFPGSSFKILTAAAALDEGITGTVSCRNGRNAEALSWEYAGIRWRRNPGRISDYSRGGHGSMDLASDIDRALAVSCNVFFARLATKLGPERLHRAMTNAELKQVPSARELAEHLPYDGFGQIDVKTSPVEMAMLAGAAAAAREGAVEATTARPHWVQAVVTKGGRREPDGVAGAPDRNQYRPFPPQVAQQVREMMVGVVEDPSGTAHRAFFRGGERRLPGITVGGKTGTAEFEKGKGRIGRHAWFVGFARSDHEIQPRTLAFAVLVEDVRPGGTGGEVCAPVARDVIARLLPKPGEQPPMPYEGLERFYQEQVRRRLGPLAPVVDWFRDRMRNR